MKSWTAVCTCSSKVNNTPGCIKRAVASREREVVVSLHSALVRSHLECCIQAWSPQHKKDLELLKQVQRRDTKTVRGLQHFFYER